MCCQEILVICSDNLHNLWSAHRAAGQKFPWNREIAIISSANIILQKHCISPPRNLFFSLRGPYVGGVLQYRTGCSIFVVSNQIPVFVDFGWQHFGLVESPCSHWVSDWHQWLHKDLRLFQGTGRERQVSVQLDGFSHLRTWRPAGLVNNRSIPEEHRSAHQTKPNQKQKFWSIILFTEIRIDSLIYKWTILISPC